MEKTIGKTRMLSTKIKIARKQHCGNFLI